MAERFALSTDASEPLPIQSSSYRLHRGISIHYNPEDPSSNAQKDPDDWVSGDEPMTGAQRPYLKTLSEQAHKPEAFSENISKAEASKRINELKPELDLD